MTFVHNINPVILSLGPLEVRWYGLMYVIGFFLVYFFLRRQVRKGLLKISEKQLDDFLLVLVVGMLVGSRLFAVFVYNPGYYLAHPLEVPAFWKGGLSFHGALLGLVVAGWLWCRKNKVSLLRMADFVVIPGSLAQVFGRIGNFINGELFGKVTSLPWSVQFPGVAGFRHPTQLYEALYNLIIFFVLFFYSKRMPRTGKVFALFLVLYAVFRILVEFIKDMPLFGPLTMGQWLSLPVLVLGLWMLFRNNKNNS